MPEQKPEQMPEQKLEDGKTNEIRYDRFFEDDPDAFREVSDSVKEEDEEEKE